MTEYEKAITTLAKERKNEIFYNSSDAHACIVLNNMIKNAEKYVHSICGDMCGEVNNNPKFLQIVEDFLKEDANRKFYILFDEYNNGFPQTEIAKVLAKYPNQVMVKKLKQGHLLYKNKRAHLTISDDRAFRLETNVNEKMAFGNFNDSDDAKILNEVFSQYFNNAKISETIDLADVAA
jgi:hypothetical protein